MISLIEIFEGLMGNIKNLREEIISKFDYNLDQNKNFLEINRNIGKIEGFLLIQMDREDKISSFNKSIIKKTFDLEIYNIENQREIGFCEDLVNESKKILDKMEFFQENKKKNLENFKTILKNIKEINSKIKIKNEKKEKKQEINNNTNKELKKNFLRKEILELDNNIENIAKNISKFM